MKPTYDETSDLFSETRGMLSEYALRVNAAEGASIEVSIDGAAYRPCLRADGYWWYHWSGAPLDHHHMVVVIRSAAGAPHGRAFNREVS